MFPEHLQVFVKRVEADEVYQMELDKEIEAFLLEVQTIIDRLKEIK
jgi:hypothetical protein